MMLLAGDMAHVVNEGILYNIMVGKCEGMRPRVRIADCWRVLKKWGGRVWTGFATIRIGTIAGLLWTRQWNVGFR